MRAIFEIAFEQTGRLNKFFVCVVVLFTVPRVCAQEKPPVLEIAEANAKNYLEGLKVFTEAFQSTNPERGANTTMLASDVLRKARKSTDYQRLDTVAIKLQGGPFSTVFLDVMKYPEFIFTSETIGEYRYEFKPPSTVNNRTVYVVSFTLKSRLDEPHYFGNLYIDTETLALVSAKYELNVGDRKAASRMFVKKKPRDVTAYPLGANYQVDYREKNGKWHYGYGRVNLSFKVDKKGKLFNTTYTLASEMAVTDWEPNPSNTLAKAKDRLRPNVVITDQVSGFSDPDFWGPLNVIEPEKSIESAINKIRRQLRRNGD